MFSQALYMLVDQRSDIQGSLNLSIEAMKGNKLTLFALYFLTSIAGVAIILFTCLIGTIFVVPFGALLTAVVYLGVTGQPTALEAPAASLQQRTFGAQPTA
jgi:uncharacterized membrane protein